MRVLSNFHAHSTYCDGANTPEEMVRAAIAKDFNAFGLSGHAPMTYEADWCMTPESELAYAAEMARLKQMYAGQISLFCGVERDTDSAPSPVHYDYVIGSVHAVYKGGVRLSVDESAECQQSDVRAYYGGDYYAYARDYFRAVAEQVQKTCPDIIGHFDLIAKFNEGGRYFDENDARYLGPALEAMEAVCAQQKLFEINTGAMNRAGRTIPYPAPPLMKALREMGGEIIFSSDSHESAMIGFKFDEAAALARSCGFKSAKTLTEKGFAEYLL